MDFLLPYGADLLGVVMGVYLLLAPRHFIKRVNEDQKRVFGYDTAVTPQGFMVWFLRLVGVACVAFCSLHILGKI